MKHLNKFIALLSLVTLLGIQNISAQCSASFTSVDNGGGNISFTETGTGSTSHWSFGDGNTSTVTNPTHTYTLNGTYWVQFTASDSICYDSTSQQIVITSAIPCTVNAGFTYTDNGNGLYTFTSTSTGGTAPYAYLWSNLPANDNTIPNPMAAYSANGSYHPCLTVTDANGCISTFCDSIQVSSVAPCNVTAGFTSVDNGNGLYSFTSTSTGGTAPYAYLWNFGGANTNTSANPTFSYTANGLHNPTLNVTDANGCSAWYGDTIYVNSVNCNYSVTAEDSTGTDGYFFASPYSPGASYFWDFGDGNTSTNTGPIHTYATPGTYYYCLTVDSCPPICDSITITITPPCNVTSNFTFIDNGNGNYSFTNNSTGVIAGTYWNFGDGTISNSTNPTHTFLANGTFVVELISIDSTGLCVDYEIATLNVSGISNPLACNASFVMIPDSAGNNSVIIFNTSTGNNLTYFWDFGDGNTSTLAYPFYSYTTAGPFQICLTIDDGNGCSSTYCDSINSGGVVLKTGGFDINVQGPIVTAVENELELISDFNVYPNPFKNDVTISLNLLEQSQTEIFVMDVVGNKVALISNQVLNAGNNKFNWKATNIANGVYFLNIKTNNSLQVEKLILNR